MKFEIYVINNYLKQCVPVCRLYCHGPLVNTAHRLYLIR